tara:strand:- start:197 stop:616 length:420 start_codon:yes stop_codon:yes gene_type:complete
MVAPEKKLREVLFSLHPLSYRIKKKGLDKESMNKKLFTSVLTQLKKIEDRRDFMSDEIGIDMTAYEDQFFNVIEDLMKMSFNKSQMGLIQMYLYQLSPDKSWDGTITVEVAKSKEEKRVNFKTPLDVWKVIQQYKDEYK